ncbi:pyroglutamyl-peptidase [Amphibacillus marinus]|uniref:Pyroglutamyl-peptidase I n=1 Tax=Amphibacillus marinus TaxID=872970 RepID=A0A1H8K453_9BACI|nr:pyroglutamyl-peptidase I [Amphibacillus marinus]SEN87723.1 pyroglutamyl-peptidase [Amphibacillus marinus]
MKILLTGFEPFLELKSNPTEVIVKRLNGAHINDKQVIGQVLPVDFARTGDVLIEAIKLYQPDVVLSLGLAFGRTCMTPERIAINCIDGEKDNAGNAYQDKRIITDGADGYFSTLPIRRFVEALGKANLPAKISNTAGTYLCNLTMYHALHYAKVKHLDYRSGFVHIPASHQLAIEKPTIASWSLADLQAGVELMIDQLAEQ